jgi:hypothetical protein
MVRDTFNPVVSGDLAGDCDQTGWLGIAPGMIILTDRLCRPLQREPVFALERPDTSFAAGAAFHASVLGRIEFGAPCGSTRGRVVRLGLGSRLGLGLGC